MHKFVSIALLPLLAAVWALSSGTAKAPVGTNPENENPSHRVAAASNRIVLAEAGTKENKKNGKASGQDESGTKTAPGKNESPSISKSKPSNRFVPSEKIWAEQGVDFPHDI